MKAQRVCLLSGVLTFVACGGMTPKTMISATISPPIEANCEKVPPKGCAELVGSPKETWPCHWKELSRGDQGFRSFVENGPEPAGRSGARYPDL